MTNPKILIVDDEEDIRDSLRDRFQVYGYEVVTASDGEEALEKVEKEAPELVLLDIKLPKLGGMKVLSRMKLEHPEILVIMITAHGTVKNTVEAMKQGAYGVIEKPFVRDIVRKTVVNALERQMLVKENESLRGEFIGETEKIKEMWRTIQKAAPSDLTVLITGERGTGKELVARALHKNSPRSSSPESFAVVNCSAIPSELMESEIFGHERGAFSGATEKKPGKMELAAGGTLFLDEIGDMAYELQAKLLRAIQEKEYERVGGTTGPIKVDVRFIAATNKDIEKAVQEENFRRDLFDRLDVLRIHIPPLLERKDDIPLLIEHFVGRYSNELNRPDVELTRESKGFLLDYDWPGNVRELKNCIESTILLADSDIIRPEHLPQKLRHGIGPMETPESGKTQPAKYPYRINVFAGRNGDCN